MKRIFLFSAALLSSCSQQPQQPRSEQSLKSFDVAEEPPPPGVNVTAAPGVAFNYRYAFRLPGNRISQLQEEHAQACEKMGITKCRITGMRYRLVDQKDVEAMLALRLDPAIARQFGKDATAAVQKADGMLVDEEINGEDVGSRIMASAKSEADLRTELASVEAELNRKVPMVKGSVAPQAAVDRQSLLDRASEIRKQLSSLKSGRDSDKEALAGTPMVFNYGSGSFVPGFDVRSPIRDALQRSADNFIGGLAVILVMAVTLVPWLMLAALAIWIYRRYRRRFPVSDAGYRDVDGPLDNDDNAGPRSKSRTRSEA